MVSHHTSEKLVPGWLEASEYENAINFGNWEPIRKLLAMRKKGVPL